jgi:ABC-2 type transport system permease protein
MTSNESAEGKPGGRFSELLKVEGKLSLREPYGVFGIALPVVLLIVFDLISNAEPGNVGSTAYTVLDLYIPTLMVIGFITIALGLPNSLIRDREIGWLRRVSTTPVHPSRLLAAQLILNVIYAVAMVLIVIFGGEVVFGAPLDVNVPLFVLAIILSIAAVFSLGLIVAAVAPSQTAGSALSGVFMFGMLFLSGLWTPPALMGEPLQTIIYYSPAGAAARLLLSSVFNTAVPLETVATLVAYAVIFSLVAIRYFRWE